MTCYDRTAYESETINVAINYPPEADLDYLRILREIAVPRPNHSPEIDRISNYIQELLSVWSVPHTAQAFSLRPHNLFFLGLTGFFLAGLFFFFILLDLTIPALIVALALPAILTLECELFIPVVSWIVRKTGRNVIMNFTVTEAERELIFCAHYDSKTDVLDHARRNKIYRWIPLFIVLSVMIPLWSWIAPVFNLTEPSWGGACLLILSGSIPIFWGLVFLGLGGYVFLSKTKQSRGAADNAGSVTALLWLARDIVDKKVDIGSSNVTIVLTQGEEVNLQGADAYVKKHFKGGKTQPGMPTFLVNLELAAQNGNMVYSDRAGVFLRHYRSSTDLAARLDRVREDMKKPVMDVAGKGTNDSQRFLSAGIPSITIGHTGLPGPGHRGLHTISDTLDRINPEHLEETVLTLKGFIEGYNAGKTSSPVNRPF